MTDIDGVLLDFEDEARCFFMRHYNLTDLPHTTHWNFEEGFGVPKHVVGKMWDEAWTWRLSAFNGAEAFLSKLCGMGLTIEALSSRAVGQAQEASLRDMERNRLSPYLNKMTFVEPGQDKGPLVKERGADYFLDDAFKNIFNVGKHSPSTRLFLMDRPWNQSQDIDPPYVRVRSYEHIIREVMRDGYL